MLSRQTASRLSVAAVGNRASPPHNLPIRLTSFVGRERELAEVMRLLTTARLLTLTGTGGCGKSRLALRLATELLDTYPDGVWLVELAALNDSTLVPLTVARALEAPAPPGRTPVEALVAAIKPKRLLLVLDNCEHLVADCAALAETLLLACPSLRILATSREALGIDGETVWRVPSLALPAVAPAPSTADLAGYDAIRLFVERAQAAAPGFALTEQTAAAVTDVCRRLDGVPLALELAAARLKVLTVDQVADRLDDRFRLLVGGSRTALPRHQTLRATLDWSHSLLDEAERALLRRLAVFAGGWTLEAAEAVGAGDGLASGDVLDVLARLVDKSLVQADTGGDEGARYRLLETVRQYAGEKLADAGEADSLSARHAGYFLALAERVEPELWAHDQLRWLARLDAEHDNLHAALAWFLERDPAAGLRLAPCLARFWLLRSFFTVGLRLVERLLAAAPAPTAERAAALRAAASLARNGADRPTAWRLSEEGLAVSRALGDRARAAEFLSELGALCVHRGEAARARAFMEEAAAVRAAAGSPISRGNYLYFLGRLAEFQADYDQARELFEETLALGPAGGMQNHGGFTYSRLGMVALARGDIERARALVAEALTVAGRADVPHGIEEGHEDLARIALWQGDLEAAAHHLDDAKATARMNGDGPPRPTTMLALGQLARRRGDLAEAGRWLAEARRRSAAGEDRWTEAAALHELGLAAWDAGDAARAPEWLRASLAMRRDMGARRGIAEGLEELATVAAGRADPARAARLLGAAEALREVIGAPLPPVDRPGHEAIVAAARAALGAAAFAAAWAAGRALTIDQAVGEALDEVSAVGPAGARATPTAVGGLSPREVEVLRLVAAGRSNREIAEELAVSVRTVERHITNLYGKIEARNRADATAFAIRHALA
jgi:non-specific serine/threonine protein kinase